MELEQHAEQVERLLKGRRPDGYEIVLSRSRDLAVEVRGGKVDAFRVSEPMGVAVRLQVGEGLGFSYSTSFEPAALDRMVEGALVAAAMQTRDPARTLPSFAGSYPELPGLYDPGLSLVDEEEKVARVLELERRVIASDPRVKRVRKCAYGESSYGVLIRNSHGINAAYRGTFASVSASAVAEADGDAQTGWDFDFGRGISALDFARVGEGAGRKATSLLGARPVPTMRCPAVLDNRVATDLLEVIASSFLGENVHKGKSLFAGKSGERVFSELVTLRDNGLLPQGIGSAPCDGEGVPQQDTLLVRDGVLQGFLYDSYWGKRMGVPSTGNAVRGGVKAPPKLEAHNLYLEPGAHAPAELLSGIKRGILVTDVMGMHTANPISGDFSVGAAGFYVEEGAVVHPVKGIAIAGNLLELFRGVEAVGNDLRFFGAAGSPSLRIGALDVSGT